MDCIKLFKHFNNVLVKFVHRFVQRFANEVTHLLAIAVSSMLDMQEHGLVELQSLF